MLRQYVKVLPELENIYFLTFFAPLQEKQKIILSVFGELF